MSDVFAITVAVPEGTYPSVNHIGRDYVRGGRKSAEYIELARRVQSAAIAEMDRTGWKTATTRCSGAIIRYRMTRHKADASNLGKTELDALEKIGVIENDELIDPITKSYEYDPAGPDRVVIVLVRRFPPAAGGSVRARRPRRAAPLGASPKTVSVTHLGEVIAEKRVIGSRSAYLDGKPIGLAEAKQWIEGRAGQRGRKA